MSFPLGKTSPARKKKSDFHAGRKLFELREMWVFFLALPGALLGLNLFLVWAAWRLFSGRRPLQFAAAGTAALLLVLFLFSFAGFARRGDGGFFGFAQECFAFGVVPMIYLSFWAIAGTLAGKIFPKLSRFKFVYAGAGVVLVAAVCVAGFLNFEHPRTRFLTWETSERRVAETPPSAGTRAAAPLRIVAAADWHLGTRIGRSRAENFVRIVNAQNPDVVVIAGDLIDGALAPVEAEKLDEVLRKISAPLGVFATLGNHEYFSGDLRRAEAFMRRAGIRLLQDGSVLVGRDDGKKIFLVGRDDATNFRRAPLAKLLEKRPAGVPVFVSDHQPRAAGEAVAAGADFVFCGHTHGGQLWPVTWLVGFFNPHVYGLWRQAGTCGYVTSGTGLWHIPYRIGSDSEIVVIDVY